MTTSRYWILFGKLIVFLSCVALIYFKITDPESFGEEFLHSLRSVIAAQKGLWLVLVMSLMPVNWFMEAYKWKILARPISELSLIEAYKGVLSGLSVGFVTPHGVGDYIGRISSVEGYHKGRLIGSIWMGRAMQMIVTLLCGLYGVYSFVTISDRELPNVGLLWIWTVLAIGVVAILFRSKIKVLGERLTYYFSLLDQYTLRDYLLIFVCSLLRYAVFATQFLIILCLFQVEIDFHLMFGGVSWMFLMKSVIPSFNFLSDLGIREWSMLTYFDYLDVSQAAVVAASLLLWIINILIPVLVGLYYVVKLKVQQ